MIKENKQKDWRPIWLYVLVMIGVMVVVGVGMGILAAMANKELDENTISAASTVACNAVLMIIFIIIYRKKLKDDIISLNKKNLLYIVIGAIVIIAINEGIVYIFNLLNVSMDNQQSVIDYLTALKIPVALTTIFAAPLIEEFVCRYSIRTLCPKKITFVIVSGVVFGLLHGVGIATLLYILMGALFAILYLKNDENIMVPIIAHLLNNLFAIITLFI